MASKILFYRLKYKFLIINYIYMLHRKIKLYKPVIVKLFCHRL